MRGRVVRALGFFPLGDEPNDGVLKVSETRLTGVPLVLVPALHTYLMNSRIVVRDLVDRARAIVFDGSFSAQ